VSRHVDRVSRPPRQFDGRGRGSPGSVAGSSPRRWRPRWPAAAGTLGRGSGAVVDDLVGGFVPDADDGQLGVGCVAPQAGLELVDVCRVRDETPVGTRGRRPSRLGHLRHPHGPPRAFGPAFAAVLGDGVPQVGNDRLGAVGGGRVTIPHSIVPAAGDQVRLPPPGIVLSDRVFRNYRSTRASIQKISRRAAIQSLRTSV